MHHDECDCAVCERESRAWMRRQRLSWFADTLIELADCLLPGLAAGGAILVLIHFWSH
jgi:hypothetical protein